MTNSSNANVRPGIYTIVRRMPAYSQGCQYRAKSALDSHERVVDEAQLRRACGGPKLPDTTSIG